MKISSQRIELEIASFLLLIAYIFSMLWGLVMYFYGFMTYMLNLDDEYCGIVALIATLPMILLIIFRIKNKNPKMILLQDITIIAFSYPALLLLIGSYKFAFLQESELIGFIFATLFTVLIVQINHHIKLKN